MRRSAVSRLSGPQELTPKRLPDLEPRHRRRVVLQAALRVAVTWVLLVAGYYYVPPLDKHSSAGEIITLVIGLLVVTVIVLDQARRVVHAELPGLRAAEALAVVVPIFLLLFSALYLSLSHTSAPMFSQKLDHSSALYFTITVFSTVGFGDIVPATDAARLIVSAQMIIDLVIIGVVVRLLINAAKMGLERAHQGSRD
jgi:voltage-gated potassium channel